MSHARIPFPEQPWTPGAHPAERKKHDAGWPMTLLEFDPGFRDPAWCRRAHYGLVLEGRFGLEFDSEREEYGAGDAFAVLAGTSHLAFNAGNDVVRIFVVSFEPYGS